MADEERPLTVHERITGQRLTEEERAECTHDFDGDDSSCAICGVLASDAEEALHARIATLEAQLATLRADASPLLTDLPCSAPSQDPESACTSCGQILDEPHSWRDCAAYLREDRARCLNVAVDNERRGDDARAEAADLQRTFDLRWKADMRAIAKWQAEDPGARELIWPDRADLGVWLLGQLRAMHRRAQAAEANPKPLGDQHEGCRHEMRRYWERRRRWTLRLIAMSKGLGARMVAAGVPDWFLNIHGKRCEHGEARPVELLERLIAQRDGAEAKSVKLAEAVAWFLPRFVGCKIADHVCSVCGTCTALIRHDTDFCIGFSRARAALAWETGT